MSNELRFENKVAIVTGAGGGLGRSHALLLASRGAQVVVNDLGGSTTGDGASQSAADQVVAEIREAGGEAVANYDSVVEGDKIVQTAIDTWGRVDIVINNAGILRDVSFAKMTDDDWDKIYQVHVLGAFKVCHAAWPHMREQRYGRIVNTASAAGIYGNFGQANYATAKLGLVGFGQTLALEGHRRDIQVNTIAPIAGSRLTETVLPPNLIEALKPEYVSPLVAYLCHEDCTESGGLFELGGGFFSKLRWERTAGRTFRVGRQITIEDVGRNWERITSFERSSHPRSVGESMQPIFENLEAGPSRGGNRWIDADEAIGFEYPETTSSYDERDLAIYALGVGAARDPNDKEGLKYVYEMFRGGMKALPTYAVIPALNQFLEMAKQGVQVPGLNYGLDRILHGEQYTELKYPLPTSAHLTHRSRVKDIFDKGKHALVVTETVTCDEAGNELAINELTALVRGAGGWGGERGPSADVNVPPERAPDAVVEEPVDENQALLYRLSGDWNPLHADPGMATAMGFERPILHGLCTFGFAGRQVIDHFAPDGNPDYFKSIRVRFADSVFPGETLVTKMWKASPTRIVFQTEVKERESVVISNAAVELYEEPPRRPEAKQPAASGVDEAPAKDASPEPTARDVFVAIRDHLERHPDVASRVGNIFLFKITDPEGVWTLDLKNGAGSVEDGETQKPDCTLEISQSNFLAMTSGAANPMTLFTSGKLRISGDIMASQKLDFLQQIDPEAAREAVARDRAAGGERSAPAEAAPPAREPNAPAIFAALEQRLVDNPALASEVQAVVGFTVTEPEGAWVVDFTAESDWVRRGPFESTDVELRIGDADLTALVRAETTAQALFQRGKLRIDGDVSVAHRLGLLKGLI